jgi:hypothetical protein
MGTLCGGIDMYDACVKKLRFKGKYDFTYVSDSQVIVKKLDDGSRTIVKSNYGCEILKLNVFRVSFAAFFGCANHPCMPMCAGLAGSLRCRQHVTHAHSGRSYISACQRGKAAWYMLCPQLAVLHECAR